MPAQKHSEQLGTDSVPRLLWRFSLPAIAGTMVHATYNIVDRIYLGHAIGEIGIAATTVAFPIMLVLMAFGMLIAHGGNALVSIRLGENREDEAEHVLGQAVALLAILSVVFSTLGLLFLDPLLQLCGATEEILPAAREYMQVILLGIVFHEISFAMNNFIRGEGSPKIAMMTMVLSAGMNLILDPIFLFGLGWGMRGAAFATVLSQVASSAWVIWYYSGRSQLKIRRDCLRLRWRTVLRIAQVGSPPFAMQTIASVLMIITNQQLKRYGGENGIAAMGIIFACNMIFIMPVVGICMGMQPIVGYNHGARRFDRVRHCLLLAMGIATAICIACTLLVQGWTRPLIGLFGDEIPVVIEMGTRGIRIFMLLLPLIGFQFIIAHYYQAVGKAGTAMLLSLARQAIFRAPLLFILPGIYGLDGIWYTGPAADFLAAIMSAIFVFRELRNLNDGMADEGESGPGG